MPQPTVPAIATPVIIPCADGVRLHGHFWQAGGRPAGGTVIINAATGVPARYYGRYAAFLASHGFDVWTYDYRGIGESRPARLRGCGYRWRDWGEKDFSAVLKLATARNHGGPLLVVGHSIGGFLPGLAENSSSIDRMLTVGAQYAYWPDYARGRRGRLFFKWHVVMPALTALFGYFPGKRLGWLEDLPAGVAYEWSFRRARIEPGYSRAERPLALRRLASVKAPILAVAATDDELGTPRAIRRALNYYSGAKRFEALLTPADFSVDAIGHFGLFHERHAPGFWLDTLIWLRDGCNPWPDKGFDRPKAPEGQAEAHARPYIVRYY